jgi:arylsulfatase A-like enzyme
VRGYLACISFMDDCLGRVLGALERSRYSDNTIVVLWSDHGWHLGEKLHWRKFTLWEEATRNVLTIRVPGMSCNGSRHSSPVSLLDIYPTLVELCGLEKIDAHEGTSLVPALENSGLVSERPVLTTFGRGNHSLRSGRWRYTRYHDGGEELYDHGSDAREWNNLAGDSRYESVKRNLAGWLPQADAVSVSELTGLRPLNERIARREL